MEGPKSTFLLLQIVVVERSCSVSSTLVEVVCLVIDKIFHRFYYKSTLNKN